MQTISWQRQKWVMSGLVVAVAAACFLTMIVAINKPQAKVQKGLPVMTLAASQLFYPDIFNASRQPLHALTGQSLAGGITSHHLPVAARLINEFYAALGEQHPSTVVVLVTNHFHFDDAKVRTAAVQFVTPLGQINTTAAVIRQLAAESLVVEDGAMLTGEHGIWTQIPFIQRYLGNQTLVLPLIVGPESSEETLQQLEQTIRKLLPADTVWVLSSDLCHYLSQQACHQQDEQTIPDLASQQNNLLQPHADDAYRAGDLFFLHLQAMQAQNGIELDRGNSADFGSDPVSTTGYVSMVFPR